MKRAKGDKMPDETSKMSERDIDVVSAEHSAVAEDAPKPVVTAPEDGQNIAKQTADTLACEVVPTLLPASSSWPDELRELSSRECHDPFKAACAFREGKCEIQEDVTKGRAASAMFHRAGLFLELGPVRRKAEKVMNEARERIYGPKEPTAEDRINAALKAQFTAPFRGDGLSIFQKYLRDAYNTNYYNHECLVLQSSGSGKSRLVTEATRQTLGILLNVRDQERDGYPRCDEGIADEMKYDGVEGYRLPALGVALVVCAVLESLTQHLQLQLKKQASYKEACANIASIFSTEHDGRVDEIEEILQRCKELRETCGTAAKGAEAYRADRPLYLTPEAEYRFHPEEWSSYPLSFREEIVVRHHILDALSGLHRLLQENEAKIEDKPVCVIIGIDEVLDVVRDNLSFRKDMTWVFHLFERYQQHVCEKEDGKMQWHLFFPLLCTRRPPWRETKPQVCTPSSREGIARMMDPFLAFPFDVHATAAAKIDGEQPWMPKTLTECPTIDNLKLLGRPLWSIEENTAWVLAWRSLYHHRGSSFTEVIRPDYQGRDWWRKRGRCLAMLSRRLSLPFRFGLHVSDTESSQILETQVEKYARQLLHVGYRFTSRWSAATSEPLLSHLAFEGWICYFLMKGASTSTIVEAIFSLLKPYRTYAALHGGDVGEVAAQVLLIAAADEAKLRQTPALNIAEESTIEEGLRAARVTGSLPEMLREQVDHVVLVTAFLKCLLSREAWASLEASDEMPRFMEEMSSYSFYLTHFTRTFEHKKLETPAVVRNLARRGAGIQTPPNYEATNLIIPIFRDGQLDDMTVLQVQVKNCTGPFELGETEWKRMEAKAVSPALPMVNILMSFEKATLPSVGSVELEKQEEKGYATRQREKQTKHGHRWRLSIHGGVYRSVSNPELESFLRRSDEEQNRSIDFGTQQQCNEFFDWSG